jgi:hypothetical protein
LIIPHVGDRDLPAPRRSAGTSSAARTAPTRASPTTPAATARIGFTAVLHTWGSALTHHLYLQCRRGKTRRPSDISHVQGRQKPQRFENVPSRHPSLFGASLNSASLLAHIL